MSRTPRFHSANPIDGHTAELTGPEAQHALRAVRLRVGQEARLFDGSGAEFVGKLVEASRGRARFEIVSRQEVDREPGVRVIVATAIPKGRRADYLIEKCCELGATQIVPLWCERSVVDPRVRAENHLSRWRRVAVEASKQCGRTRVTHVAGPATFGDVAESSGRFARAWVCRPGPETSIGPAPPADTVCMVAVGPEGGFTEDEIALADQVGMTPLGLGPTVLRVETAAVVALARLTHRP